MARRRPSALDRGIAAGTLQDPLKRFETRIPLNHVFLSRFPVSHPTHTASVPPTPRSPHSSAGTLHQHLGIVTGFLGENIPRSSESFIFSQHKAPDSGRERLRVCWCFFAPPPSSRPCLSAFERRSPRSGPFQHAAFCSSHGVSDPAFVTCDSL